MKAKKFTLLIVDDNEDDLFFLEDTFQRLGTRYRIHSLTDGFEAIAYLKGEGKYGDRKEYQFPSYIITDLKMSPGDGFHLLEFIKTNPALSVIPVVMLSASEDPDDIRQAYLLGASCYFTKPSDQQGELRVLVTRIHEHWSACEVPEVDEDGYALMTDGTGKLGQRYPRPKRPTGQ